MICHIDFESEEGNITHCKSCGQNLHNDCIDDWTKKKPTCSLCNARWINHTKPQTTICRFLDADGFDVYFGWLYRRELLTFKTDEVTWMSAILAL
jgi:hypothetical protein